MKSGLLHKLAFTGYPHEVELLEAGGDRLFEVDSLRQPGQRMLVALAEDGTVDYPVFDPEKEKVSWKFDDRFGKKFKSEVKKHMQTEVEKAETPEEEEEATNDPSLRKAAKMGKCHQCHQERSLNREGVCHECEQGERDAAQDEESKTAAPRARIRENAWGNWYGYIGNKRVEQFFNTPEETQEQQARRWLAEQEAQGHTPGAHRVTPSQYTPSGRRASVGDSTFIQRGDGYYKLAGNPREDLMGEIYRQEWRAKKRNQTVHDLKPLMDKIRNAEPDSRQGPALILHSPKQDYVRELIALAKGVGATGLRAAAVHYLDTIHNANRRSTLTGVVPRRTQRALENAWKRVEAEYVHFVR